MPSTRTSKACSNSTFPGPKVFIMHYTLADLVIDIVQNGAESGADKLELLIKESGKTRTPFKNRASSPRREFHFTVKDNGKGMTEQELEQARDPFKSDGIKHPWRRVGLGIPFLIQTAEISGGAFKINSRKGRGTQVSACFDLDNPDTPPVGDIPGIFRSTLLMMEQKSLLIKYQNRIAYKIRNAKKKPRSDKIWQN